MEPGTERIALAAARNGGHTATDVDCIVAVEGVRGTMGGPSSSYCKAHAHTFETLRWGTQTGWKIGKRVCIYIQT